ncbi:MAG: hypothetical protein V1874_04670 [Spirochaetota bacterium]
MISLKKLFFGIILILFCSINAKAGFVSHIYYNEIKACQNDMDAEPPPDIYQEPGEEQDDFVPGESINQPEPDNPDENK